MADLIHHLALRAEWEQALAAGADYRRSTLGVSLEEQGFIHCSFADQVQTTADLVYGGRDDVLVLDIDVRRVEAEVRVENVTGADVMFPHIYGPLPLDAVVGVRRHCWTRTWPADWERRLAGVGCGMCENEDVEETEWGTVFYAGAVADAVLQRNAAVPGYTVVIWARGHATEPDELSAGEATAYWHDVLTAARAIRRVYGPAKMNYQTLGNSAPHLHTHLIPRYLDDVAPEYPLPWDALESPSDVDDTTFARQVAALRAVAGSHSNNR